MHLIISGGKKPDNINKKNDTILSSFLSKIIWYYQIFSTFQSWVSNCILCFKNVQSYMLENKNRSRYAALWYNRAHHILLLISLHNASCFIPVTDPRGVTRIQYIKVRQFYANNNVMNKISIDIARSISVTVAKESNNS